MTEPRVIEVVADWEGLGGAVPIGRLTATPARGKEVCVLSARLLEERLAGR